MVRAIKCGHVWTRLPLEPQLLTMIDEVGTPPQRRFRMPIPFFAFYRRTRFPGTERLTRK